ncbi:MAG: ribose 5-phosphate isomerase B [Erysipelotrichaceae bacterium]|nr:ribose 5-phosphate isomerase B [Erysipelotrichaceae bacterium]
MKIAVACDHAGYRLKGILIDEMKQLGHEVIDFGTDSEASVDFPDYAVKAARAVANGECERGVVICGTGIGVSISANKVNGIRCALCGDVFSAKATRAHNNANMLALGERVVGPGLAVEILKAFLSTDYEGGRHDLRIKKMMAIEKEQ